MKKIKILDTLLLGDEPIPKAVLKQSVFFYKTALLMLVIGCAFSITNREWLGILASIFIAGIITFFGFTISLQASRSGTEIMMGKCVGLERNPVSTSLFPTWVYIEPEDKVRFPDGPYRFPYKMEHTKLDVAISSKNGDLKANVQVGDILSVTLAKTAEFAKNDDYTTCYSGFYGYERASEALFSNDPEEESELSD